MGFVLRNVVRIDEDVVQIDDDYNVNHTHEDVVHKSLKSWWCISKPFRHYQPLKGTISGSEGSFPFISRHNLDKMVHVPEVDFGVDLCFIVRATLRQSHYYNQRYSKEGGLMGSEHTGTLTQWLSSEIKLRGTYCVR